MSKPMITLTDVKKAFGKKQILNGVSLDVQKGESLVIIGGSGTGKSVTLKCVLGLLRADSGSIRVMDQETTQMGTSASAKHCCKTLACFFKGPRFLTA